MDTAKEALLLLAIDPLLRGVLLASGPGMGKSLLARAFHSLLPASPSPRDGDEVPFVRIPLSVTEDRLLGGLSLDKTISSGRRQLDQGLLAQAHTGVVSVDHINRLDSRLARYIVSALNEGSISVERDGISHRSPAEFLFISTYDPEDGLLADSLTDSIGLHVDSHDPLSIQERVLLASRVAAFSQDPGDVIKDFHVETMELRSLVTQARQRLNQVETGADERCWLIRKALHLGVEGNRVDLFATRAARAHAALRGGLAVQEEDLEAACQLVLFPRASKQGDQEFETRFEQPDSESQPSPVSSELSDVYQSPENIEVETIDSRLSEDLLTRFSTSSLKGAAGIHRRGDPSEFTNPTRGRYVRAVAGDLRHKKIAMEPTLRAAAPFQTKRRRSSRGHRLAVSVQREDLRFKVFKQKAGLLIIFIVDASGSMAVNRLNQAKGAVTRLLQQAYVHRDQVALISFRGNGAEVLLPPTRSVELAKRALDAQPAGGGTPLAAGLVKALETIRRGKGNGAPHALLVILTDGRANVMLKTKHATNNPQQSIWDELERLGHVLQAEPVTTVVVETQPRFVANGECQILADLLGARVVHLPRGKDNAVYETVANFAEDVRTSQCP